MHNDRIRAASVDGMCDVTTHILNILSFTVVIFIKCITFFIDIFLVIV